MAITRKDLRRRLGEVGYLGDTFVSTVGSSTATTLVDATLNQPNNFFNKSQLVVASGTCAGNYRLVSGWESATHTFTVDRAFVSAPPGSTPAGGDEYEVHKIFSADQKNEAIKNAILMAKLRWPRIVEDETLVQTLNQYEYTISGLTIPIDRTIGLDEVRYEEPGLAVGELWPAFDPQHWFIRTNAATMKLQFKIAVPHPTKKIRLVYRTSPPLLVNDTAALDPDDTSLADFIVEWASYLLCAQRSLEEREDTVKGPWIVKGAEFKNDALRLLTADKPQKLPGTVKFGTWGSDPRAEDNRRMNVSVGRIRL